MPVSATSQKIGGAGQTDHRRGQRAMQDQQAEAAEERREEILRSFAAACRATCVLRRGEESRRATFPEHRRSSPVPRQLHQAAAEADLEEAWTGWGGTCPPAWERKPALSPTRADEGAAGSSRHADPRTTVGYTHLIGDDDRKVAEQLEELFAQVRLNLPKYKNGSGDLDSQAAV